MTEAPAEHPAPTGPPRPARHVEEETFHGRVLADPYRWLGDPEHPDVLAHLQAENAWTEAATAHLADLSDEIFGEIKERTQEDDLSVPVREGAWWYHLRTAEGLAYPVHCRRPDDGTGTAWVADATEEVVFDPNELVDEGEYLGIGVFDVSPDGNWLAFALDRDGDERHELRFKDLRQDATSAEVIDDVAYGFAWAADSASCWYTMQDERSRPDRVLRHRVGDDPDEDIEVWRDDDEHFHVHVAPSRSGTVAVIGSNSAITSESWLLDAQVPDADPQLVVAREHEVEYGVAHHPSGLYVTSNHGGANDFALWRAPLDGITVAPRDQWDPVLPHQLGTRIQGVETFAEYVIVHGRTDGVTALWRLDPGTGEAKRFATDEVVATISAGANPSFDTVSYRFSYQSLTTPPSVIDQDLTTGERTVRKQLPVLGGFSSADYTSAREWARADDGAEVPMSLVWRPDRVDPSGPSPCVLYGYGAYEASMDPWFSTARLSLLDRGVVFALAHVRGGGEMGRQWYTDGKFAAKSNTFSDFVACGRHLIETGRTAPDRLAARGGSAGGLLVGAATNLAPELFRAVVAEVPFVDPLTTMLDPSLPLTVIEWEEWGDPLHDPEAFDWIRSYSPVENIGGSEHRYPAVLATAGLTDPRVGYHEPAKWVAHLRDHGHGAAGDDGRPVLLKVELGAGHAGPTGRYDAWKDEAFTLAFLLGQVGNEDRS